MKGKKVKNIGLTNILRDEATETEGTGGANVTEMPSPPKVEEPKPEDISGKVKYFDLIKFERATVEVKGNFLPAKTADEAKERAGEKFLVIMNKGLKRQAISDLRSSAAFPDSACNTKVIAGFINNFRPLFALDKKLPDAEQRKDQTNRVIAMFRGNEAILQSIKTLAAAIPVVSDEDGEDSEDSE